MSMRNYIRDYDGPAPTPAEQLRTDGKRSLFGLILVEVLTVIGILCVLMGSAHGAVTGEWRVNLLKGSSTVQPASVGATHEEAWAACLARIPKTATTTVSYKCQTPVYAATVTPDPTCPPPPTPTTRSQACPAGSSGTWTQTSTSTVGAPPTCAVTTTWSPSSPPAGACTVTSPPALTAPTNFKAVVAASTTSTGVYNVTLTWTAVAGATGYDIDRCTGPNCSNFTIQAASGFTGPTTYLQTGLPAGLTLSYGIRAKNATATGPWVPTPVVATTPSTPPPPPPPPPVGTASLEWVPPTANVDGAALTNLAGFRILYGAQATALVSTIDVPNPALTKYVVDRLPAGTWYFAVRAYLSNGAESVNSNVASKVIAP